jgi:Mn-containing catalase
MDFCDDPGTLDTLQFLMTREITHMKAFSLALESLGKPALSIGRIPPTPRVVNQYFNDSTGIGDRGEPDARGPWNEANGWEFVEAPAFQKLRSAETGERDTAEAVAAAVKSSPENGGGQAATQRSGATKKSKDGRAH